MPDRASYYRYQNHWQGHDNRRCDISRCIRIVTGIDFIDVLDVLIFVRRCDIIC